MAPKQQTKPTIQPMDYVEDKERLLKIAQVTIRAGLLGGCT